MALLIKNLEPMDFKKAIAFAIEGMALAVIWITGWRYAYTPDIFYI